ncbi:MAG: VWA-like domain-containing protein [Candidatus Methanomethylicaceae archaeon]
MSEGEKKVIDKGIGLCSDGIMETSEVYRKIRRVLPARTAGWIIQRLTVTDADEPLASVFLSPEGYKIQVSKNVIESQFFKEILLHELLHIVRGDLLSHNMDKDPQAWNIACDATINRDLRIPPEAGGIKYEDVMKKIKEYPTKLVGSSYIFQKLLESEDDSDSESFDELGRSAEIGDVLSSHISETRELKESLAEDKLDLPVKAGRSKSDKAHKTLWTPTQERVHKVLFDLNSFLSHNSKTVLKRSYRRERHPLLRATTSVRTANVAVFIDVSGSTNQYWEIFTAVARYLKHRYQATVFVFDDEVRQWNLQGSIQAGGGTLFRPIAETIRKEKADIAIIITDGEFFDATAPVYGCKLAFVVPRTTNRELPGKIIKIEE